MSQHATVFEQLQKVDLLVDRMNPPSIPQERLPFTVRIASSRADLIKAVEVRHAAYARHKPTFAQALREPEPDDSMPNTVVMLAESKLDGSALGTVRVQINRDRPLNMESSVDLPPWLKKQTIADARRLAVVGGTNGGMVKMILFKALFQYWEQNGVDWAVVAARPPLDRTYLKLMFHDVLGGETFIPQPRENNEPHQVLAFEIQSALARWTEAKHPLIDFIFYTHHPDIDVTIPESIQDTTLVREYQPSYVSTPVRAAF